MIPTAVEFSTFRGPSWVGSFASPAPRGSRELRQEDQLFRRLFRWSDLGRSPPHRHPVEIGPSVACRTFLPLPAFWGGGDFRPDHELNLHNESESRKAKNEGSSLWITGISGVTADSRAGIPPNMTSRGDQLPLSPRRQPWPWLPFRSHMPRSWGCPNPRPQCQTPRICRVSIRRSARRC